MAGPSLHRDRKAMYTFLVMIISAIALLLIVIILIQSGKGGGLAASFGGASSSTDSFMGGRQAATVLTKLTWIGGALFIVLALVLTVLSSRPATTPESVLREGLSGTPLQQAPTSVLDAEAVQPADAEAEAPAGEGGSGGEEGSGEEGGSGGEEGSGGGGDSGGEDSQRLPCFEKQLRATAVPTRGGYSSMGSLSGANGSSSGRSKKLVRRPASISSPIHSSNPDGTSPLDCKLSRAARVASPSTYSFFG